MIELGVNSAIIITIALGATPRIMGDRAQADDIDIAPPPRHKPQTTHAAEGALQPAQTPQTTPASPASSAVVELVPAGVPARRQDE